MRRKHTYGLAFLAVLVAAAAGFLLARRVVGPVEIPQIDAVAQAQTLLGDIDIDINSLIPRRTPVPRQGTGQTDAQSPASGQAIVEPLPTSAAVAGAPVSGGQIEDATPISVGVSEEEATETPAATPTAISQAPTPTSAQIDPGVQFVAAGPARHGNADCPGASIRGVIRDASGAPLGGVRLWRYDQWGNEQVVESKGAASDVGQYDFPLGDTPNAHYVQVVDAGGVIISPVIEIEHRQGEAPDAACHWLDWVQR